MGDLKPDICAPLVSTAGFFLPRMLRLHDCVHFGTARFETPFAFSQDCCIVVPTLHYCCLFLYRTVLLLYNCVYNMVLY